MRASSAVYGASSAALRASILNDSPTGYWICDEADGATVLADSSGNGYDLTVVGSSHLEFQSYPLIPGDETKFLTVRATGVGGADRAGALDIARPITGDWSVEAMCMMFISGGGTDNWIFAIGGTGETSAVNFQLALRVSFQNHYTFWESASGTDRFTYPLNRDDQACIAPCMPYHVGVAKSGLNLSFYLNGRFIGVGSAAAQPSDGSGAVGTVIGRSPTYLNAANPRSVCMGHIAFYNGVVLDRFAFRERAVNAGVYGRPL